MIPCIGTTTLYQSMIFMLNYMVIQHWLTQYMEQFDLTGKFKDWLGSLLYCAISVDVSLSN